MSYLTICIEFVNPNIAMGHIKDARACYTTSDTVPPFGENFVLYPGRKRNPLDTGRSNVTVYDNVIIEDSLSDLSFDQGINTFSTFENPQTFSFQVVDFDNAYNYITKTQKLSGRVLVKYSTEDSDYPVALLDLYSVTVSNGIATFECDSVSSWNDNQISGNVFYGDIQNKELKKSYTETLQIYPNPIAVRKVEDGRFPEQYVVGAPLVPSITIYEVIAYNTVYKNCSSNTWRIYLDLPYDIFNSDVVNLSNHSGKTIKVAVVDGKGVGSSYFGKLHLDINGNQLLGYYIEFDMNFRDSPEIETFTRNYFDKEIVVSKIDSSTHVELFFEYNVYDMESLDISDINDISIIDDQGVLRNIPSTLLVFEDGKLKIPTGSTITYKAEVPLILDYSSANLYSGDYTDEGSPLSIAEANAIVNDHNSNTFVGSRFIGIPGESNYMFYDFKIGDIASNLSKFKNADKYVLNGKIESVPTEGSQELSFHYRWFDNNELPARSPFEYTVDNQPVNHPIKAFTNSDGKWYTLNRTFINATYSGNVSGGENYTANQIELDLTEDSDEIKSLGLFIVHLPLPLIGSKSNIRLYDLNICAEFSYKISEGSKIYISLKGTHPKAGLTDLGEIIADLYTSAVNGAATAVSQTQMGTASFVNTFSNSRKAIADLISESPYCLHEQVSNGMDGTDFYYYKSLIPSPTWQYTSFAIENLPIIDVKSVVINDDWVNTIRLTSGDSYYQLGTNTEDGALFRDPNNSWYITNTNEYNLATSKSFNSDGVIKNIDKELKYIVHPNSLAYQTDVFGRPFGTTMIPFGKSYKCKFTAPLNADILFLIFNTYAGGRFIITSHPALFNNSQCVMRINKMDVSFQEQTVDFECFIYEIRDNPEEANFTLWFDSPFQDYTDKIQDNMNNGNDADWYVGAF